MSDSLKTSLRWLGTGCFLALVLFVAPNCAFQTGGLCDKPDGCDAGKPPDCPPDKPDCNAEPCNDPSCPPVPCDKPDCNMPPPPTDVFVPGPSATDAIMCDFPNAEKPGVSNCATQAEVDSGVYLSQSTGATSLATSQKNNLTLDWSPAALTECLGLPKKVEFLGGAFPDGQTVCIDAAQQFPNIYANPTKACIARCEDVIAKGPGPMPADIHDYCVNNAHTSTNFDKNSWYPNACSGGTPVPNFADPRRTPEPVKWTDLLPAGSINDNGGSNSLTRTAATSGGTPVDFNAGAGSAQTITKGDAWVELESNSTDKGILVALRTSCADPVSCPDADPTVNDLGVSLMLHESGGVYAFDSSTLTAQGPFGTYAAGERYRVKATDQHDGTASITFVRIVGACPVGALCNEAPLFTVPAAVPYPLRVDVSMRAQDATLANVTLVRIKE